MNLEVDFTPHGFPHNKIYTKQRQAGVKCIINNMDLRIIYRTSLPNTTGFTFCLAVFGTFSKTDHIL